MYPNRREFLKTSLGAATLATLGPEMTSSLSIQAALSRNEGTIFVLVQLPGGNDGLNTVVPYADDVYARSRSTLRLKGTEVHKIDDHLGFHPQMPAFLRLLREGQLAVVQGVGFPTPEQQHPAATQIWMAGDPSAAESQTGWLGRLLDHVGPPEETGNLALHVGQTQRPFSLNAARAVVSSVRSAQGSILRSRQGPAAETSRPTPVDLQLDFVRHSTFDAQALSRRIESAVLRTSAKRYPQCDLARSLHAIAQLIRAEAGVRIFCTELGGGDIGAFDTHAGQAANHGTLLEQLSESVAAFVDDLRRDRLFDRVLLMTFSEFGRTISENGRRGTDHGRAAPVFLAGGRLHGGLVGRHPRAYRARSWRSRSPHRLPPALCHGDRPLARVR